MRWEPKFWRKPKEENELVSDGAGPAATWSPASPGALRPGRDTAPRVPESMAKRIPDKTRRNEWSGPCAQPGRFPQASRARAPPLPARPGGGPAPPGPGPAPLPPLSHTGTQRARERRPPRAGPLWGQAVPRGGGRGRRPAGAGRSRWRRAPVPAFRRVAARPAGPGARPGGRGKGAAADGGNGRSSAGDARRAPAHVSTAAPSRHAPRAPAPRAGAGAAPAPPGPSRRAPRGGWEVAAAAGPWWRRRLEAATAPLPLSLSDHAQPGHGRGELAAPRPPGWRRDGAGDGAPLRGPCGERERGRLWLWGELEAAGWWSCVPSAPAAGCVWQLPNSAAPCGLCCAWPGGFPCSVIRLCSCASRRAFPPSPGPAVLPPCAWAPPVANRCFKVC